MLYEWDVFLEEFLKALNYLLITFYCTLGRQTDTFHTSTTRGHC